jgi:predicted TIM-barrel fold metal-dependent hydrolase
MTRTIDVHHHILPDFFYLETNDPIAPVGGIEPPHWSVDMMMAYLDEAGIDVAITSISSPGVHIGDGTAARTLARRCNEFAAELIRSHPQRLGGFAAIPLPDVDGALEEIGYAFDTLKLDGVVLFTNSNGVYLGDASFDPVFAELEKRKSVVFVHPTASPDASARRLGLPDTLIDFTADTTRAFAQMHYGNRFARTPNVKYIFSHAGGTVPYLAGRWAVVDAMNVIPGFEERGTAADTLRRMYWDTAISFGDPVLRMLRDIVGLEQAVFGSDHPYVRHDIAVDCVQRLEETSAISDSERAGVMSHNAATLFPRFAS